VNPHLHSRCLAGSGLLGRGELRLFGFRLWFAKKKCHLASEKRRFNQLKRRFNQRKWRFTQRKWRFKQPNNGDFMVCASKKPWVSSSFGVQQQK
jgi:hypothetical protein